MKPAWVAPAALAMLAALAVAWPGPIKDLFFTPDQLGRWHYERGEYREAAAHFEDPLWRGLSYYAAGDFAAAGQVLAVLDTAEAHILRGNSFAHRDRLELAVAAYSRALRLAREPDVAQFNLEWVSDLIALRAAEASPDGALPSVDTSLPDMPAVQEERRLAVPAVVRSGLNDEEIEAMWMRRVQTTPADFLALKFASQAARDASETEQ